MKLIFSKVKPEDRLPRFEVRNGAILDIAFPCYYLDVLTAHDSHWHDYKGWPAPNYHGTACQFIGGIPAYEHAGEWEWVDMFHPHPIDLLSDYEGYTDAYVVLDNDTVDGITVSTWFDEDEPNVIYMRVKANLAFFEDKPKEYRFTLFAHVPEHEYQGKTEREKIDQVIRGKIVVLPGDTNTN